MLGLGLCLTKLKTKEEIILSLPYASDATVSNLGTIYTLEYQYNDPETESEAVLPPTIKRAWISGTTTEGETLTANIEFFSPNGKSADGIVYKWYDDGNNLLQSSTTPTYVLQASDAGSRLYLRVVPIQDEGSVLTGEEVYSAYTEEIEAAIEPVAYVFNFARFNNDAYGGDNTHEPAGRRINQMINGNPSGTTTVVNNFLDSDGNTVSGSSATLSLMAGYSSAYAYGGAQETGVTSIIRAELFKSGFNIRRQDFGGPGSCTFTLTGIPNGTYLIKSGGFSNGSNQTVTMSCNKSASTDTFTDGQAAEINNAVVDTNSLVITMSVPSGVGNFTNICAILVQKIA